VNSGYNVNGGGFGARSGSGNPMFGRTHSDKVKASMSAKRKGKLNPNFDKNASPNTKRAMSLKKKGIYLGENNPKAKLTNEQAQMVRVLFANGDISINQLAKQFGVHRNVIERILRNETYKENK
jgi:DNA invertase Pin-like site-specific DNA recombinase